MKKQADLSARLQITLKNLKLLVEPIIELVRGAKTNSIPWGICTGWMALTSALLFLKVDHFIISHTRFSGLYPYYPLLYKLYAFSLTTSLFWLWAWSEVKKKKDKLKVLTHAFKNAGLESKIGRLPNLISDFPIDPLTRKMRLTNAGFPLSSFQAQSNFIESELGVFIDEIKESREKRAVDIIYSHFPMPSIVEYSTGKAAKPCEFFVGQTRSRSITASFKNSPHLLVAGETGGGKSTFLRQLIVHLHIQQKNAKFLLIDLKGGLEFSLFDNRDQFTVVPDVHASVQELKQIDKLLDDRMKFLKENNCKDIDGYIKKETKDKKWMSLHREFIVVDEAAEMFLAGPHAKAKEVQVARAVLSRVARQGRAVGINLVIATQVPTSKSLDPQIKSNLTSVISFRMMTDSASIAVLGNGRATDLPKIPGRAIWKNGIEMLEVQTPLLTVEAAEALLGPANEKKKQEEASEPKKKIVQIPSCDVTEGQDGVETD